MKLLLSLCVFAGASLFGQLQVSTVAPGRVWYANERPTFALSAVPEDCQWELRSWRGETLAAGAWQSGDLQLALLQPGYYVLRTVAAGGQELLADYTFSVVMEQEKRDWDASSVFAMDVALSWLCGAKNLTSPWYDGDGYRLTCELLKRAGVPYVRDRLSWRVCGKDPAAINFGSYMKNVRLQAEHGLTVSGMFHDAPEVAQPLAKLPRDLKLLHDFCAKAASDFGDTMGNWEFWNEQDIHFAPEPVWDYVACQKAAYLGFKSANPAKIVLPGAVTRDQRDDYDELMYENDMAKYSEVVNLHSYVPLARYGEHYGDMRRHMARHGLANRALWVTEWNSFVHGESAGPDDPLYAGRKEHSFDQELLMAEYYVKAMVLQMMHGVGKSFYFVFPAYRCKNPKMNLSFMRSDGSAKAILCACSAMTGELMQARLLGEVKLQEGVRAFVFQQADTQTLVFWSVSTLETSTKPVGLTTQNLVDIELSVPAGSYRLTDTLGATREVTAADGKLALQTSRFPSYLSGLRGLAVDVPAVPRGEIERYQPGADEDLSVVIRVDLHPEDFVMVGNKTKAEVRAEAARMNVVVWNFSSEEKRGVLLSEGGLLAGLPAEIILPAQGKAEIAVTLDTTAEPIDSRLVLSGRFNGRVTSRLVMPYVAFWKFAKTSEAIAWDLSQHDGWVEFGSSDTVAITADAGGVRFDLGWDDPQTDRWFYPRHALTMPVETLKRARFLEFEVKSVQDDPVNAYTHSMCSFATAPQPGAGKKSYRCLFQAPNANWELRRVDLHAAGIDWDNVRTFHIGGNPKGMKVTYWVRNVRLLCE